MLLQAENELITRVGPGTPMGNLMRRFWLPFALSTELPNPDSDPVRVRLLCEDLIAFRDTNGTVGLIQNHCPHRGASLFFGRNEDEGLRCVYHGWKFDTEGNCIDMPNEPAESDFKSKVRATAYPVVDRGGVLWAYLGNPDSDTRPLTSRGWSGRIVPESHRLVTKRIQYCSYLQNVEGEIDSSHVSFLHSRETTTDQRAEGTPRAYMARDRSPRASSCSTRITGC